MMIWLVPQWGEHPGFSGRSVLRRTPGATPPMWKLKQWRQAAGGPELALQAHGPAYSALNICLAMDMYGPKWRNDDPPCGMDALKWACLQIAVALAGLAFVIIYIALLIILDPTMTATFST